MREDIVFLLYAVGLFVGMVVCMEGGARVGRRLGPGSEKAEVGMGAVDGAIFGMFGLLLGFTFAGAATRFDTRRQLVIDESNEIGTAYKRIDLLPPDTQPELRRLFRDYLDSRLAVYREITTYDAEKGRLAKSEAIQDEIWTRVVAACHAQHDSGVTVTVVQAVNGMIDITTTRTGATRIHPPPVVYALLFLLGLGSAALAGHGMAGSVKKSWLHTLGFAGITAFTVYVIINMEYPRVGLIRINGIDAFLVDLRATMK